jgi:pimeloyl-ACP methyl ester carboxylesterase
MPDFATSADGTRIAYDRYGDGPTVILVGGAFQHRALDPTTTEIARQLATRGLTVVDCDRRGRGDSIAIGPFTLAREIEDIAALIDANGGEAALYGSSSGGSIALAAAAAGLPITKLALWEVPLDDELGTEGADFLAGLRERIAGGDNERVVEYFMQDMPPEWVEGSRRSDAWPLMCAVAPSLEADSESLAWSQSAPRAELWATVTQPTLVLLGEETLPFMPAAADSIVRALPNARLQKVPASDHQWDPAAMQPILAGFFGSPVPATH